MAITIRPADGDDAARVRAIYAPAIEGSTTSFEFEVPSPSEMASRIERATPDHPWLVAERAGDVVGYAYATRWRARPAYGHTVETAVYVDAAHHRQGIARALLEALLSACRARGHHMAIAGVALPNDASIALHERLGFRPVGVFPEVGRKLDRWCDVGFWSLCLAQEHCLAQDRSPGSDHGGPGTSDGHP